MAKDDYFVIAYIILKHLYERLKSGEEPDLQSISSEALGIPENYRAYVIENLTESGYITGVNLSRTLYGKSAWIENIQITPKGIEYLQDNEKFRKVEEFLKNIPPVAALLNLVF